MSNLDIPAIRKALAEATPFPQPESGFWDQIEVSDWAFENYRLVIQMHHGIPALLAEIERLRQVEAAAREYRREWHSAGGNAALLGDKLDAALDAALGGGR